MKVTNHDLHIMLVRIEGKMDGVESKIDVVDKWQKTHEKSDKEQFKTINASIQGMNKYAASIALVAGAIGVVASWAWNKMTGA